MGFLDDVVVDFVASAIIAIVDDDIIIVALLIVVAYVVATTTHSTICVENFGKTTGVDVGYANKVPGPLSLWWD